MKSLEIILRLLDNLLTAIKFRKAQDERSKLEENPANWFTDHFSVGLSDTTSKANKTNTSDNPTE